MLSIYYFTTTTRDPSAAKKMSEAKKPPIQDLTPRTQMMQMKSMQDMMQNGMKIRVEETDDERLGGPQKCGRKFMEYWRHPDRCAAQCKTNDEVAKHIPDVDVKFKVYRLSDFDQVGGTIFVSFVLM